MSDHKIGTPKDLRGLRKGFLVSIIPAVVLWLAIGFVVYAMWGPL